MNFHFIRIAHAVARHRKFLRTPSAAKWLWVLGIIYAQEVESDGFIPREVLPMLGYVEPDIQESAERLVQAGLWIEVEGGYTIHDYLDYNYSAAQIEQLREVNRVNGRKGGLAKTRSGSLTEPPTGSHSELVSESPSPPVKQIRSDPIRSDPSRSEEIRSDQNQRAPSPGGCNQHSRSPVRSDQKNQIRSNSPASVVQQAQPDAVELEEALRRTQQGKGSAGYHLQATGRNDES